MDSVIRQNIPTVLVIFGATGDLMKKKIAPALFHLYQKQKTPQLFRIIGVSRRSMDNVSFQDYVKKLLFSISPAYDAKKVDQFIEHFQYQQADFLHKDGYIQLAATLGNIDGEWRVCSNKLFYLAVPPEYYESIFVRLAKSGLTKPCSAQEGWTRVLVEKPFGKDAETARRLDMVLGKLFKEEQIYRIDHYLAKEMLQNIIMFRFSNNLLESSWSNANIERIELRLLESVDVKGRGVFYDAVGALRDVGQNHLLQMLALITMENPHQFDVAEIHKRRAAILDTLQPLTAARIKQSTVRGQYVGYHHVDGVKKGSETETYFRVNFQLRHPRWQGVPMVMESGKAFPEAKKEIIITFKNPESFLCPTGKDGCKNKVIISLEPNEEIKITLWSKEPGLDLRLGEKTMHFTYREKGERMQYVEEYEKLLLDAIDGNQLLFITTKEIQSMWKFIDPITNAWRKGSVPLQYYQSKTWDMLKQQKQPAHHIPQTIGDTKELGIIGLGKIGGNIARRLIERNWHIVGYNRSPEITKQYSQERLDGIFTLSDFAKRLIGPRVIWITVPAGEAVDTVLFGADGIVKYVKRGDILIDGGNSLYTDTIRRAKQLQKLGIHYVDVGFSGGPGGARNGGSLMVGGSRKDFEYLLPLFLDMAVPGGVMFFNGNGAGHFVKMIHNGIEYGMMQAIAEGFTILKTARFGLDLSDVAHVYNHGSVIESKLIEWLENGFKIYGQDLESISGTVAHTGEGAWTVNAAHEMKLDIPVIYDALQFRINSQKHPSYMGKILSTLRNQFGGHAAK